MKRLLGVVAGLALVVSVVPSADALCIAMEAADALVSPAAGVLPTDGGILVGWETVSEIKPQHQSKAWKLTAGGASVSTTRTTLAPGLTLVKPAAGTEMITVTTSTAELARYTRTDKVAAFAPDPPAPTKLELTTSPARYSGFYRTVTATLSAPAPGDAIGVITYAMRKKKKVALSYNPVAGGSSTVITFRDPGRCSFGPPGAEPPKTGEKVTLVWVDEFGRLSKPSAPIAMTGSVPKEP